MKVKARTGGLADGHMALERFEIIDRKIEEFKQQNGTLYIYSKRRVKL